MGIVAHQQIKKTGLNEVYLEVKQRVDKLEGENAEMIKQLHIKNVKADQLMKENAKLKAALKKLEKENEKLKNPPIWMNEGEL